MRSLVAAVALLGSLAHAQGPRAPAPRPADAAQAPAAVAAGARAPVLFDWFEYSGRDAAFGAPLPEGHYRNPVLAGFHPDPSITRAGDRYYLVTSSFTLFPGIPVFESADLVHWTQIGHVIDRPTQLDFDGLGVSRGVFAPAIEYRDGTFYVLNTSVDSGGNFVATATDPAGPWSDPTWLPTIDGIDPSLFFDDDGRAYLLNNGPPEGEPRYDGHRAIWMQAFDIATLQPTGPRRVLVDGGVDPSTNPIWIEGPHIYKRDGWYYLNCAEGGTGPQHSQVVLRSREVWGPYVPNPRNPILTQRDLPEDRIHPITNAGHADLVEAPDGTWWATFLASRTYGGVHYNTGRETFLLPVTWEDGWPSILAPGRPIPYAVPGPSAMTRPAAQAPSTGNFTWRDDFDGTALGHAWMHVRVPKQPWVDLARHPGRLAVTPLADDLDTLRNPAFLGRRQQHIAFEATTALEVPSETGVEAGIAAFQSGPNWYFMGVRRLADGGAPTPADGADTGARVEIFLERSSGRIRHVVATRTLDAGATLQLKIEGNGADYAFGFDAGQGWEWLARRQDGTLLSTDVAGGFIGALVGPHARMTRETGRTAE